MIEEPKSLMMMKACIFILLTVRKAPIKPHQIIPVPNFYVVINSVEHFLSSGL